MKIEQIAIAGGLLVTVLAACQTVPPSSAAPEPATLGVRKAMIDSVNPAALQIWAVGNDALDDDGAPDPSKLDSAALKDLKEGATLLGEGARRLALARDLRASGPDLVGGKVPEGVATREQIQAAIDANPAGFRAYAAVMGDQADGILKAIESGDKAAISDRLMSFDGACQSCHEKYWYVAQ
ncbi:cytochrome c [Croceibacterium aestuarii]|uniref:cytochrome c n=1 Tax=Croceibacterium aestuarii TaxID=3064139 RepID=UPI00272E08A0|nr:cytochrome c [Croceibacterium sp. D39]